MKRTFLFNLLILPLLAFGQNPTTLDGWAERLQLFGEKIPQEEIFVHMDNSCYYLGDTLYYKAYMRLSDGRPSTLSQLLYVELLNQDGYLVERQKVEMKQGQGNGSIVLLDTLYGGYYELRVYTRWQLNWGLYEHDHSKNSERWFLSNKMMHEYYRDYDKLYSRVFPVYDHPRKEGEYMQNMTTRPLRRMFRASNEKPKAVVTFYPEGGDLVEGVPNRVAFEVNDEDGKHLKGRLTVGSQTVETVNRGRGAFETDGTDRKAIFEWEDGNQSFDLPKTVPDGVAMQATVADDGIHVRLHKAGVAATEVLGLTASSHGVLKDYQTLTGDEIVIPLSKLTTGVVQLTVFNADGRIYADRLVFVRQPDFQPQNITFSGLKDEYAPYEKVELTVQAKGMEPLVSAGGSSGSTSISLAVRDAVHSDYTFDSGNIMTEMLLSSQIKGFVEQPEYFFESDDEEHRRALDLLLMVQGWRRYDWVEMATPNAFTLLQPYERTEVIMGEVSKYMAEDQANAIEDGMDAIETYMDTPMEELAGGNEETRGEATTTDENLANNSFADDDTRQGTTARTNVTMAEDRFKRRYRGQDHGSLRKEAMVHAEFVQAGAANGLVAGEMDTYNNGLFRIEAPRFYDACNFFYAAIDKDHWKGENHVWIEANEDKNGRINYPEYYVKLTPPYPRFVKPYNFYQQTQPSARKLGGKQLHVDDDAILMNEVTVGARRGGMRSFDASKPAFVLDAYVAFNDVCDAGFCPGYFIGADRFAIDVARTYIGDMNQDRAYELEQRFNTKNRSSNLSAGLLEKYNHLPNLDMVYVYTDYSPRREGDKRFTQANQPIVTVDLRRFEDESMRMAWLNRHAVLRGYAVCEDFYQPDYSKQKPAKPTDYRRTLYWNPNVSLDAQGNAKVQFYNNSRSTQITVSAEGMTATGQPLTGISYPEDR